MQTISGYDINGGFINGGSSNNLTLSYSLLKDHNENYYFINLKNNNII